MSDSTKMVKSIATVCVFVRASACPPNLTAGIGYFAYTDTIGNSPFYDCSANGNSVDLNGDYIYDYKNTELFAELSTKVGAAKKDGEMEFSWSYMDTEADSVIGTFNDSDFGDGNTGTDGHVLKAKYAAPKKIFIGGTLFLSNVDRIQGNEHDYNRLQLDVEFKFD